MYKVKFQITSKRLSLELSIHLYSIFSVCLLQRIIVLTKSAKFFLTNFNLSGGICLRKRFKLTTISTKIAIDNEIL